MRIVEVWRSGFRLSDGREFPIDPPLQEDLTVEEFQRHYDYALAVVRGCTEIGCDSANAAQLGQERGDQDCSDSGESEESSS
jgi:hypothetical protein